MCNNSMIRAMCTAQRQTQSEKHSHCWFLLSPAFFSGRHTGQSCRVQFFQWEMICLDEAQCATGGEETETERSLRKGKRSGKKEKRDREGEQVKWEIVTEWRREMNNETRKGWEKRETLRRVKRKREKPDTKKVIVWVIQYNKTTSRWEKEKGKITVEQPARERISHSDTTKNWEANQEGYKQQTRTSKKKNKRKNELLQIHDNFKHCLVFMI